MACPPPHLPLRDSPSHQLSLNLVHNLFNSLSGYSVAMPGGTTQKTDGQAQNVVQLPGASRYPVLHSLSFYKARCQAGSGQLLFLSLHFSPAAIVADCRLSPFDTAHIEGSGLRYSVLTVLLPFPDVSQSTGAGVPRLGASKW